MNKKIIYVGDPVCSWCYAFTDTLEKIKAEFESSVEFSYIMGGLIIDRNLVLDEKVKRLLRKNWKEVETKTGKKIKALDMLETSKEFPYISDPGCIGFQAAKLKSEELAYSFYKKMHQYFYENLKDISDVNNLCSIAGDIGIDKDFFMEKFYDEKVKDLALKDMEKSKKLGVKAFPALVAVDNSGSKVLNQGFRKYSLLKVQIESWLKGEVAAGDLMPVL